MSGKWLFSLRFMVLMAMLLAAAASRLIPHPWNFTPIGAMALFGGACISNRFAGFLMPLGAMLLSDGLIGFHSGMPVIYASFAVYYLLGLWVANRKTPEAIYGATLFGSVQFFFLTNFAVWAMGDGHLFPKNWEGLIACYTAAIPFFGGTIGGDLTYATILFGGLALVEGAFPTLRKPAPQPV
jgi:hypothetical protein